MSNKKSPEDVSARIGRGALTVIGQPHRGREERADAVRNRERILVAARKLLKKNALHDVCMDDLARAAGVGKGTLYRRFPDRAALVHALLDADARDLQDRALAGFGLPPQTGGVEHALRLLAELFDFVFEHRTMLVDAHVRDPGQRFDHPAYAWQRSLLARHLALAMRRGQLAAGPAEVMAEQMLAGIHPELLAWFAGRGLAPEPARAQWLGLWTEALRPVSAPRPC